jgi:hypothetical protein
VAQDAIARQYDVDKNSVQLTREPDAKGNYQPGTISFRAKQGKSIDVEKIHESIKATRLSGGTRMQVTYLEITATGAVEPGENDTLLFKVAGTGQQFTLSDDAAAGRDDNEKTPFQRLRGELAKGEKAVTVTGRVGGWSGAFPQVLSKPPVQRMKLAVTGFETGKG